jgi:hypothetical protein
VPQTESATESAEYQAADPENPLRSKHNRRLSPQSPQKPQSNRCGDSEHARGELGCVCSPRKGDWGRVEYLFSDLRTLRTQRHKKPYAASFSGGAANLDLRTQLRTLRTHGHRPIDRQHDSDAPTTHTTVTGHMPAPPHDPPHPRQRLYRITTASAAVASPRW